MKKIIILTATLFLFSFCEQRTTLPAHTGKLNEVLVVIETPFFKEVGKDIKRSFAEEVEGIPQPEGVLDPVFITKQGFSSIFKTHRNVFLIEKSEKDTSFFKKNAWAKDQLVFVIKAKEQENAKKILATAEEKIKNTFIKKEKQRTGLKNTKKIKETIGKTKINFKTPEEYFLVEKEKNFVFYKKETSEKTYGIWASSLKGFIPEHLFIEKRDSIVKHKIKGEKEGTYMVTEQKYNPYVKKEENKKTIKGLWKIKGDFMGGPFILNTYYNKKNNETLFIEGFLFYPKEKKNSMVEIESILDGVRLN